MKLNSSIQLSGESGERVRPDYYRCRRSSPRGRLRPDPGRRALHALGPETATPPLNHLHKTPHQIPQAETQFLKGTMSQLSVKLIFTTSPKRWDSIRHQGIEVKFWASITKKPRCIKLMISVLVCIKKDAGVSVTEHLPFICLLTKFWPICLKHRLLHPGCSI